MKRWKRLFYYLLINVLVSACTTVAVLVAWDRTHAPAQGGVIPQISFNLPARSASSTSTLPPSLTETPAAIATLIPTPTQVFIVYQVETGDDFASIAEQFGVSEEELIAVNGFTQAQPLGPGEVLRIPVTPTPAADTNSQAEVAILRVIGEGDLSSERVVLEKRAGGGILLAGWQLLDENGNAFTFPYLELVKDGFQVEVYTKAGTNNVNNLYWGLDRAVWRSGETVTLRDADGNVRATYRVQ
ncbi:MAG: lamin tail domain-containing protein [Anaerolineales bacterium]|jgi:LysM repeat protein